MEQTHIIVKGRVQGVFFRDTTAKLAQSLGLKGWVRNTDHDVEIVAQGNEKQLQQLLDFVKVGPPLAKVEKVEVKKEPLEELESFKIKY